MSDGIGATAVSVILGGTSVVASLIVTTFLAGFRGRGMVASLNEKMIAEIGKLRDELRDEHSEFIKQNSETFMALREKIRDVELWNRDNFVRRPDFTTAIDSFNHSIQMLSAKFDADLTKLEVKIDKLQDVR
jgi:hypothetical protein